MAKLLPGQIGRPDIKPRGARLRGVAYTRDGSDDRVRVTATGDTVEEVTRLLTLRAAALVYRSEEWTPATTVAEAVDRWLDTLADGEDERQKPQTVETYRRVMNGLIRPRLGALQVGSLTAPQVEEFLLALKKEPHRTRVAADRKVKQKVGYSGSYRVLALLVLRAGLDRAVRMGAIPFNPALSVSKPRKKVNGKGGTPRAFVLSPAQVAVLRDCILRWELKRKPGPPRGPRLRLAIELGLATGCRIGEVGGFLLSEATEVPELSVAVTGTIVYVGGHHVRQDKLKRDEQARVLLLPEWASETLAECRSIAVKHGVEATLLQNTTGGMVVPTQIRLWMRKMVAEFGDELTAAGIDLDRFEFRTLRRSVLTVIKESTGGLEIAQAQAGHQSSSTTDGYVGGARRLPVVQGAVGAIQGAFARVA